MATQVPDNHDKAHESMTEQDAVERGKNLAALNHEAEQKKIEESRVDTGKGQTVEEGKTPENNESNGHGSLDHTTDTDKVGNRKSSKK